MFKLEFVSARGDVLPLAHNKYFTLVNVDGMTAAETDISSVTVGGIDGDIANNVQATARTIIFDLHINNGENVEEVKRQILKVVKLKQRGRLQWTQNERTVEIMGIVETVEMPRFTNAVVMQITLHCEQPFWEDVNEVIQQINDAISLHYFTNNPYEMLYFPESGIAFGEYDTTRVKSFFNAGDVSVGVEITIVAHDTVTNPIIYNQDGQYFGVGYEYESASGGEGIGTAWVSSPFIMQAGDILVITTHKGNKSVKYNGEIIFEKIKPQSTWLQLATGDNQFSIDSDDENISNLSFSMKYKQRYI